MTVQITVTGIIKLVAVIPWALANAAVTAIIPKPIIKVVPQNRTSNVLAIDSTAIPKNQQACNLILR